MNAMILAIKTSAAAEHSAAVVSIFSKIDNMAHVGQHSPVQSWLISHTTREPRNIMEIKNKKEQGQ